MKLQTVLVFAIFMCLSPFSVEAQESSENVLWTKDIKNLSNQIMRQIYDDIISLKGEHEELEGFSQNALFLNQHGVYEIDYKYEAIDINKEKGTFGFGLTITEIADENFKQYGRIAFNYGFPLLNLKFSGYQSKTRKRNQFDIQNLMRKHGLSLWQAQQKYLPFQLKLVPSKKVYRVGESIVFEVTLKNVSKHNLIVKPLTAKTLSFLYDNNPWGTVGGKPTVTKQIILNPGEQISQTFRGNAFSSPQEVEIFGSYEQTYEGINPTGSLKVNVVGSGR